MFRNFCVFSIFIVVLKFEMFLIIILMSVTFMKNILNLTITKKIEKKRKCRNIFDFINFGGPLPFIFFFVLIISIPEKLKFSHAEKNLRICFYK